MAPDAGGAVESGADTHIRTNRCSNRSDTPEPLMRDSDRISLGVGACRPVCGALSDPLEPVSDADCR